MIARYENLSVAIPPDLLEFVRQQTIVLGYTNVSEFICALIQEQAVKAEIPSEPCCGSRPIWEVVKEIGATVPESEWVNVPPDLSRNFKHYLYGAPREDE